MKRTKTNNTSFTLEKLILQKIAEIGIAALSNFFPKNYPEARVWRKILGLDHSYVFSKPTFSSILSRLRRDGFVERIGGSDRLSRWKITPKGEERVLGPKNFLKKDGILRVVSYDIPEKQRKARRWLRAQLLGYEYEQLHKSVWIGFVPLPEEFIKNIDFLSLQEHVHIFSIDKKGTMNKPF